MIRSIIIILVSILFFACGTKKEVVETSSKETKVMTSKVNESIIDSVNAQFDKIATTDKIESSKIIDTVIFIKDAKFTTTKDSVVYNDDTVITTEKKIVFNHAILNTLLQKHVTKDGIVNYKGFKKDHAELKRYIISLSDDSDSYKTWSKEDKLAYWINAYNALTVDLILRNYPIKSIKDIKKPWDQRLWMIGYLWQNLNDIEHKILRKMDEPRIHFAINCASFSCPPLLNEAFTAEKLESQLTQVTKAFLADSKRNTITANKLELSKIFKWFSKDFKQNGSLIDFLNQYSDIKINGNAKKNYKEYNWDLNE